MGQSDRNSRLYATLDSKQRQILRLVHKGLYNNEIGRIIGLSSATIKWHISRLLLIFEVDNRTELAAELSEQITSDTEG